ncbi:MAG: SAM-dependent methyltransferase [Arenicella sp.]|jgi:SAM-dependent methyltransferase
MNLKHLIKDTPVIGAMIHKFYQKWIKPPKPFINSQQYWNSRYDVGGNSGDGSYNQLAKFKADILNKFVESNNIKSVIEYGCGDGNQLTLAQYPSYIGFDVSPVAISKCRSIFASDSLKTFRIVENYEGEIAELTLSLDVIYHLIEESVFEDYMTRLFKSSKKFVIIYSSNTDTNKNNQAAHVKHRNFSIWLKNNQPNWHLIEELSNKYPFKGNTKTGSFSNFYIYEMQE